MYRVKTFQEDKLFEQLIKICKPSVEKIQKQRLQTCKPNIFPQYSEAAACNCQEEIDFNQDAVIEKAISRWAHLAIKHIKTSTDIKISEFLGYYVEITEEIQMDHRELSPLRLSLLEVLQLYNAKALSFPVACKILIAGLQKTVDDIALRSFYGKSEDLRSLDELLHAISSITVMYSKALINFIE